MHWLGLSPGRALGYRKSSRGGVWVARFVQEGFRREEKLAIADDLLDADGVQVLDFTQAQDRARGWFLLAMREATGEAPRSRRKGYTVAEASEDYLTELERRGSTTAKIARYDLTASILPDLGKVRVDHLTPAKVGAWHAGIAAMPRRSQKKLKPGAPPAPVAAMTPEQQRRRRVSANRLLTRLKAAVNLAVERGLVNASGRGWAVKPFGGVERARVDFLSPEQQGQLVRCCGRGDFQEFVRAGLYTGARLGELSRLRVEDYKAGTLHVVRSKGGKSPWVYLSGEADDFFAALAKGRQPGSLLVHQSTGRPWTKERVKKLMRRACKAAGLVGFTFHHLRHSAASTWLTEGASLLEVSKQLGHADTRMVDKFYGHLAADHLRATFGKTKLGLDRAARAKPAKVTAIR